MRVRGRRKAKAAAQHDATVLLFLAQERKLGRDGLLVTLDTTLPFCDGGDPSPLAVTLDAFLQWSAAGTADGADIGDLAGIFSRALAERFIPTGRHLQLAQFRLLDEFGVQCEHLPPEDVRSCIERLNRVLLRVNPSTADGRETIQREIRLFLAAPERKYAETLGDERKLRRDAEARVELLERRLRWAAMASVALILAFAGTAVAYLLGEGATLLARVSNGWVTLAALGLVPLAWNAVKRRSDRRKR